VIFRNVHKLLVDTASSEFLFCLDFWEDEGVFKELFGPVVAVVESDLATQLQVCVVGVHVWLGAAGYGGMGVEAGCRATGRTTGARTPMPLARPLAY
jgi:hypothetical protein